MEEKWAGVGGGGQDSVFLRVRKSLVNKMELCG